MEYGMLELLFFLIVYSFLGWCMEVLYMAVRTGKFCNRGVFNLPFCLSYGIAMDITGTIPEGSRILFFYFCRG